MTTLIILELSAAHLIILLALFAIIYLIYRLIKGILTSKFEFSEVIHTNVAEEQVLRVLKNQFINQSRSVYIKDTVLLVFNIQPAFSHFRNDNSKIKIKNREDGFLIVAEVNYKPSVLFWITTILTLFTIIGWIIPILFYFYQKGTVRTAIQDIFSRVKNEFKSTHKVPVIQGTSNLDQLEKLFDLKEKGIITEEEFITKKKQILDN